MKFLETGIPDLMLIQPRVFPDSRGYFYESYNEKAFAEAGIYTNFVQDNQSLSQKGTLRGLHAQAPPFAQGKLVRVIKGSVLDVVVDIRKNSPSYGQHASFELNEENHEMLWVPPGFLHGFITLIDNTIFSYKVSGFYNKESEIGVRWDDQELNIDWRMDKLEIILSIKDTTLPDFSNMQSPF